jgi:hypothetical protein
LLGDDFIPILLFQHGGVGLADTESNCAADIAKHGLADGEGKLIHVLMRQGQAETIFARLGQQGSKGIGREILKFVNEQEKVAALVLGLFGACHCGQLKLRHQK